MESRDYVADGQCWSLAFSTVDAASRRRFHKMPAREAAINRSTPCHTSPCHAGRLREPCSPKCKHITAEFHAPRARRHQSLMFIDTPPCHHDAAARLPRSGFRTSAYAPALDDGDAGRSNYHDWSPRIQFSKHFADGAERALSIALISLANTRMGPMQFPALLLDGHEEEASYFRRARTPFCLSRQSFCAQPRSLRSHIRRAASAARCRRRPTMPGPSCGKSGLAVSSLLVGDDIFTYLSNDDDSMLVCFEDVPACFIITPTARLIDIGHDTTRTSTLQPGDGSAVSRAWSRFCSAPRSRRSLRWLATLAAGHFLLFSPARPSPMPCRLRLRRRAICPPHEMPTRLPTIYPPTQQDATAHSQMVPAPICSHPSLIFTAHSKKICHDEMHAISCRQ